MNVIITGSTGFVGRELARRLLAAGHHVVGAARSNHVRELRSAGLVPSSELASVISDGGEPSAEVIEVVARAEVVFHLAGDATFGDGPQYQAANVEPTRRLVELLETHGASLRCLVFASTIGAQDRDLADSIDTPLTEASTAAPTSDYGRSKLEAEAIVAGSGLPVRIARLGMVTGAEMRTGSHLAVVAATARRVPDVLLRQLGGALPIVHVADASAALELLAEHPAADDGPYLVVADSVSVAEVVAVLGGGSPSSSVPSVPALARAARPIRGRLPFTLRSMLLPELAARSERLRALGWEPTISWPDAVREVGDRVAMRHDVSVTPPGWTVVTGAGSGLGRSVARRLGQMGRHMVLVDRDPEALRSIADEWPGALPMELDVTAPAFMDTVLDRLQQEGGHVSELFASAGLGRKGRVGSVSGADELRAIDVNLRARVAAVVAVLPEMTARNFGRIVLISSSSAFQALPEFATYGASNAGLLNFGQALAAEVADRGVKVLTVCPGGMDTNFQSHAGVRRPEGERLLNPDDVATDIVAALGSSAPVLVVGMRAKVMDIAGRAIPRRIQSQLWAKLVSARR